MEKSLSLSSDMSRLTVGVEELYPLIAAKSDRSKLSLHGFHPMEGPLIRE